MKIAIGCDESAFELKQTLCEYLAGEEFPGLDVVDLGVYDKAPVDYPDIAEKVALAVKNGEAERGILLCGTGIGMAIAANKVPGVRAAQVHDPYSAERASKSNNAQIITMGALIIGPALARSLLKIWLGSEFAGGRSTRKVEKINNLDMRFRRLEQV